MERLSFDDGGSYDGLEAAIHLARYAIAKPLCKGKAVLDMACGEGYGSRLLADWGARQVVGVDVSADAVRNAERRFGGAQIQYRTVAAESLVDLLPASSFDLIVSLETIEHVPDPVGLLQSFQRLLAPGGALVISCPNDWWYYPTENERNPFHLRKYTYEEFREQAERVLGPSNGWYLGGPMAGFCNTRIDGLLQAEKGDSQAAMLRALDAAAAFAIPSEVGLGVQTRNASYFVGIWGDGLNEATLSSMQGASILPVSMDAFRTGFFSQIVSKLDELQRERDEARRALAGDSTLQFSASEGNVELSVQQNPQDAARIALQQLELERAQVRSLLQAQELATLQRNALVEEGGRVRQAHDALAQSLAQLSAHSVLLEFEAARYRRIRDMFPASARRTLMPLARGIKRMLRSISR